MTPSPRIGIGLILASIGLSAAKVDAAAADNPPQAQFDRLVAALRDNDRTAFLTNSSDAMQKAITPEALASLSHDLAPHLKAGYTATYLGDLKQKGYTVRLWKMNFKDGRDDALVRVVAGTNDRLDGFFVQ